MDAEQRNAACAEFELLLEDHLSGDLGGEQARNLAEHLKGCPGCRSAVEEASASNRLLHVAAPTPDPGPQFSHLVMARIRAEQERVEQAGFWQPFVSLAWKFAATAALAIVMLFAYGLHANDQAPDVSATAVRATNTGDLFSSGLTETAQVPANRDEVLMMVSETNTSYEQH